MKQKISQLAEKLGLKFNNPDMLENAFVHRSYLNENPSFKLENNERLEFLGDAVLELISTEYLYRNYKKNEGELTALRSALVRGKNLSEVADGLGFFDYLYLSQGEKKASDKARGLLLANCLEAVIGAIYLDLGLEVTRKFVEDKILVKIDSVLSEKLYIDAKSEFQELVQEKYKVTPHYKVIDENGPDHEKQFTSGVFISDKMIAKGLGSSKSLAEQNAAEEALKIVTTA